MSERFVVIDTETNWENEVMSIGIILSSDDRFIPIDYKYIIIPEAAEVGGIYQNSLLIGNTIPDYLNRYLAISYVEEFLQKHNTNKIFAYNAPFDLHCLPELGIYDWHDILRIAAYIQHNPAIPKDAECFSTGRLKRGYSVGDIMYFFGEHNYTEQHNALIDAVDELRMMKYLNHPICYYPSL